MLRAERANVHRVNLDLVEIDAPDVPHELDCEIGWNAHVCHRDDLHLVGWLFAGIDPPRRSGPSCFLRPERLGEHVLAVHDLHAATGDLALYHARNLPHLCAATGVEGCPPIIVVLAR